MKCVSAFTIFAACIAWEPVNAGNDCGRDNDRRGRRLALSEAVSHVCSGDFYDLSVLVEGVHILLSAEPTCEGSLRSKECQECPAFVFHAKPFPVEGGEQRMEKHINEFDLSEDNKGLVLGTFDLGTLIKAFDDAAVGASKQYSFFLNNCAGLPINMGLNLGLDPTDHKIVTFVSGKLSKKYSSGIMEEISNHEAGMVMIEAYDKEDAVIEAFVSTYIQDRV